MPAVVHAELPGWVAQAGQQLIEFVPASEEFLESESDSATDRYKPTLVGRSDLGRGSTDLTTRLQHGVGDATDDRVDRLSEVRAKSLDPLLQRTRTASLERVGQNERPVEVVTLDPFTTDDQHHRPMSVEKWPLDKSCEPELSLQDRLGVEIGRRHAYQYSSKWMLPG